MRSGHAGNTPVAIANTFRTYDAKGLREDLSDAIYNISPTDTLFLSNAGRASAKSVLFDWQTDELADPDATNAHVQGDDVDSFDAVGATERVGNYTQISRKTVIIADTEEVVSKAGRRKEMAYQLSKKSAELKRDMEAILVSNQGAVAGATAVAGKTASILAWIKTNVDMANDGANPAWSTVPTAGRTDGTARAFTETMLKAVIQSQYEQGGHCDMVMVPPSLKVVASGFQGISTQYTQTPSRKPTAIIAAADVYVSDFGVFSIVPNRFMRTGTNKEALVLDFDLIDVAYLRPFNTIPLAKTGDAEKRMLVVEYGLKVHQEKGLGAAADLS